LETFKVEAPADDLEDLRQALQRKLGSAVHIDEMLDHEAGELHDATLIGLAIVVGPKIVSSVREVVSGWLEHRRKMAYLRIVDNLSKTATTPDEAIRMMKALPHVP